MDALNLRNGSRISFKKTGQQVFAGSNVRYLECQCCGYLAISPTNSCPLCKEMGCGDENNFAEITVGEFLASSANKHLQPTPERG